MAIESEQNLFQWAVGGVIAAAYGALGLLHRADTKLKSDLDEMKKEYVRRDDLATVMDSWRRGHDETVDELRVVRTHVHDIANAVSGIQGVLSLKPGKGIDTRK